MTSLLRGGAQRDRVIEKASCMLQYTGSLLSFPTNTASLKIRCLNQVCTQRHQAISGCITLSPNLLAALATLVWQVHPHILRSFTTKTHTVHMQASYVPRSTWFAHRSFCPSPPWHDFPHTSGASADRRCSHLPLPDLACSPRFALPKPYRR